MPKLIATGVRIGASTRIAALVSMNMPTTSRSRLTPRRKVSALPKFSWLQVPTAPGRPDRLIRKLNSAAAEMISMTAPDDTAAARKMPGRSDQDSSR